MMSPPETRTSAHESSRAGRRSGLVLAVTSVVVAAAVVTSVLRIEPDASLQTMLASDQPASRALATVLEDFASASDLLVLASVSDTGDSNVPRSVARERLAAFAERLARRVESDREAERLIVELRYRPDEEWRRFVSEVVTPNLLMYLDDAAYAALRERLGTDGMWRQIERNESLISAPGPGAAALSEELLRDPLRLHEFVLRALGPLPPGFAADAGESLLLSRDGRALLFRITPARPSSDFEFNRRLLRTVRRLIDEAGPGDLEIRLTGAHAIAAFSEQQIRGDMIRSVIGSAVLLAMLFLLVYRSAWSLPLIFLPVLSGIAVGFGVFGLISVRLSPVAAASGAILTGLGVDYGIHSLTRYWQRRRAGMSPEKAASFGDGFGRTLATVCITSVIGFAAIGFAAVPAVASFGLVGAIGMATVLLATIAVFPALVALIDGGQRLSGQPMRIVMKPVVPWVTGHARSILTMAVLVMIAALVVLGVAGGPGFNADPRQMHPSPSPPLEAQEAVRALFESEAPSALVLLEAPSANDLLTDAHELRDRLLGRDDDNVRATLGLATLLPDPRRTSDRRTRVDQIDADRIVGDFRRAIEESIFNRDAYAGYADFLRAMLASRDAPDVGTLAEYPGLARQLLPTGAGSGAEPTRALTMAFVDAPRADRQAWTAALRNLDARIGEDLRATIADTALVTEEVRATIRSDMRRLLLIAALLVLAWLAIMLRRPGLIALSIVPATFGLLTLLASMQIAGMRLNLVNLVAIPLIAGLGVDDGIFLVRHFASWGRSPDNGDRDPLNGLISTVQAIFMTSATTIVAFGSLMLTTMPAMRSLGIVIAVGMTGCFVGAVFMLLPILCLRAGGRIDGPVPNGR